MRTGYFDCFSGASGDMILGALVAAGLSPDDLRADVDRLGVSGYTLDIREIRKQGFAAVKVDVRVTEKQPHRHLHHVVDIIQKSQLPETVREGACNIFRRLAETEAAVHGSTIEKVHFHEVGAVDAIIDITGAVAGVHRLGLDRIRCSPIPTGSGSVVCEHGVMPVPAPATAKLLIGIPLAECDEPGELTTPTGAAILTTLAADFGPLPTMTVAAVGYGAGTRDGRTRPNVLRLLVGESASDAEETDEVAILEANLDDATGETIGHAFEAVFAAGALDVFTTPIGMKKNRPGIMLTVISPFERVAACEDALFRETTTFGVRRSSAQRTKLRRSIDSVATPFGEIRVKVGRRAGRAHVVAPEYEDCAAAARLKGASLREVMAAANSAWHASQGSSA